MCFNESVMCSDSPAAEDSPSLGMHMGKLHAKHRCTHTQSHGRKLNTSEDTFIHSFYLTNTFLSTTLNQVK